MQNSFLKGVPSEQEKTSSVAWFKLAELIARGEKEKALNLYRLLSHSLDERGYVLQVEGDILWAFNDKDALIRYQQAALHYRKENNILAAVAVYEHLRTIEPANGEHLAPLLTLYAQLDWGKKLKERFKYFVALFEKKKISQKRVLEVLREVMSILRGHKKGVVSDIKNDLIILLEKQSSGLADSVKLSL